MARSSSISTTIALRDIEWVVTATYSPGTRDYFDKSFGNWLPGDPASLEDIELVSCDVNPPQTLSESDLTKEELEDVECALLDKGVDDWSDRKADDDDRAYDEWKDNRRERD